MTLTSISVMCLTLLAAEAKWEQAAKSDGITIYSREKEGTDIREMKAIGLIDATPQEVWKAIRDYPNYTKTMPYTKEGKILAQEDDGKTIWFYSRLDLPMVDNRDYTIKISDESDWKEGKGFMKVTWTGWNTPGDRHVPEKDGVVRVKINDGYWILEPREDGKKTFATYYVYTDPGGSVPRWIANKANGTAVPEVFGAIRKVVAADRAAKK